jgi:hypothetical protein
MASRFSSLSATALARSFIVGWLVVILLAVSLGLYLLDSSLEQQRQRTAPETENLAVLVERDVANSLEKVDLLLLDAIDHYAEHLRLGNLNIAALDHFLFRQRQRQKPLVAIRIANAAGETFIGLDGGSGANVLVNDREYFQRLRDEPALGRVISKPVRGRSAASGPSSWPVACPMWMGALPESPTPASVLIISSSSLSACKPARQVPLPCAMAIWPCWPASRGEAMSFNMVRRACPQISRPRSPPIRRPAAMCPG